MVLRWRQTSYPVVPGRFALAQPAAAELAAAAFGLQFAATA